MKASKENVLDGEGPEPGLSSLGRTTVRVGKLGSDICTQCKAGINENAVQKEEPGQTAGSDKEATFSGTF